MFSKGARASRPARNRQSVAVIMIRPGVKGDDARRGLKPEGQRGQCLPMLRIQRREGEEIGGAKPRIGFAAGQTVMIAADTRNGARRQHIKGFARPERTGDAIAQIQDPGDVMAVDIRQYRFQRQDVAVDIGNDRETHHAPLEDEAREIGIPREIPDFPLDPRTINDDGLTGAVGRREADLVQHALQHGLEPPGPIFSTLLFTSNAARAKAAMPSSVKERFTPSVAISATYCLMSEASVSLRMRRKSSSPSGFSSTGSAGDPAIRAEGPMAWRHERRLTQ